MLQLCPDLASDHDSDDSECEVGDSDSDEIEESPVKSKERPKATQKRKMEAVSFVKLKFGKNIIPDLIASAVLGRKGDYS